MIKVSIIVPVYKVPLEYLRECFDSLLAQTMRECEFIVVSDGAPDAECSVCEEYAEKDPRFKFFRREHAGVSATRNFAIEQAQGEYITFVDSDDWIDKDYCKIPYEFAQENKSDIVLWEASISKANKLCEVHFYNNKPKKTFNLQEIQDLCSNAIYPSSQKYNSISLVCCKLFKLSIINQSGIRYPEDLLFSEDRIFNISALNSAKSISYLNKTLYYYRIHQSSASHAYIPNAFFAYTKFLDKFKSEMREQHLVAIKKEYIRSYFLSWSSYYFNSKSRAFFKKNLYELISIAKSEKFQTYIKGTDFSNLSLLLKFELFFLKRKLVFPLYCHYLKALFFTR